MTEEKFIENLAALLKNTLTVEELGELKTLLAEVEIDACEVCGCSAPWEWEGWTRNKDFSGNPTGMVRLTHVCDDHRMVLIGNANT